MISYGRDYPDVFAPAQDIGDASDVPLYVDIAALFSGGLPDSPEPTVLARSDGNCLFYKGQVNMLFGEPETGKTWIALAAFAEELTSAGSGLVIDLDHNGAPATVLRLLALGVSEAILVDSTVFRYAEPEDKDHLREIVKDATQWSPSIAIVDSIGELLPLLGLGSNSPDDFTSAHAQVLKPLAMSGAAVVAIDHVAKNPASRIQGATGTAAKRRAIGGTSLRVELVETFAPGRGGSARLRIHKDRHGGLRRHCPTQGADEPVVGIFTLAETAGLLTFKIAAPDDVRSSEAARAGSGVDPDVIALDLLDPKPVSQRDVQTRMGWGGNRSMKALRGWRHHQQSALVRSVVGDDGVAPCSRSAPEEQGADDEGIAPRSRTPMSGREEQNEGSELADVRTRFPITSLAPADKVSDTEAALTKRRSGVTNAQHEVEVDAMDLEGVELQAVVEAGLDRVDVGPEERVDSDPQDTGITASVERDPNAPADVPSNTWRGVDGGFCVCGEPVERYGEHGHTLCDGCVARKAAGSRDRPADPDINGDDEAYYVPGPPNEAADSDEIEADGRAAAGGEEGVQSHLPVMVIEANACAVAAERTGFTVGRRMTGEPA